MDEDTFVTINKLYGISFNNDEYIPHKNAINDLFLVKRTESEFDEIAQNQTNGSLINVCGLCYSKLYINVLKTKHYYQKASDLGNLNAMVNLGNLYQYKENNIPESKKWYQKASDLGDVDAMFCLGELLEKESNILEAKKWYQKASELEDIDSMFCLGKLYNFKEKNIPEAKKWYQKASDLGHVDAMNYLGYLLQYKENNIPEAKYWYQKACELGNVSAMNNLGFILKHNESNIPEAKKWYQKAIELGNYAALWNLGKIIEHNENNIVEAKKLYKMNIIGDVNLDKNCIHKTFTKLELYEWLSTLSEIPKHLNALYVEICATTEVTNYKNKIEFSKKYNICGECNVCLETNRLLLGYNCMHFVSCQTCFAQLKCCPLCRSV